VASEQCCALGAAIAAATVAGLHSDLNAAQAVMASPIASVIQHDPQRSADYDAVYRRYQALAAAELP
jgi:L-ribulokinase